MIGGLESDVIAIVEDWIPERKYRSESKFQNDLKEFLDTELNETSGTEFGMGSQRQLPVKREHGSVNADVAVGDEIGIELKRDFTNSQKHRLSGQIKDYKREFQTVLVVACGISDMDGWRELQNEYESSQTDWAIGMEQSAIHFIHKRKEHFGKDPSEFQRDDGGLFGGGLF